MRWTKERNIIWFNRLAWAHVMVGSTGIVKYAFEGNYGAAVFWSAWVGSMIAVALAHPRRVWSTPHPQR